MNLTVVYTIIVVLVLIIIFFIGFRDKKYSLIDMYKQYKNKNNEVLNTI